MKSIQHTLEVPTSGAVALDTLCGGFYDCDAVDLGWTPCDASELPPLFCDLLVHDDHMTTTLQNHYGCPVELRVLDEQSDESLYARKILLGLRGSGRIVEFGIVRLNLELIAEDVRNEIRQRKTPLGDILIRHDVLRRIEPKWYFRFAPQSPLAEHFEPRHRKSVFGRIGVIHCDGRPAILLLEIVADAETST